MLVPTKVKVSVLGLLCLVALVQTCPKTSHKRHNETCLCSDVCLDNAQCQRDGQGGFACLCLPCQYLDSQLGQCVDTPGEGQECTSVCQSPYVCTQDSQGSRTCQPCPSSQFFDEDSKTCRDYPSFGEPCQDKCACNLKCLPDTADGRSVCSCAAESQGWNAVLKMCKYDCFVNDSTSCNCVANGNYRACKPMCQEGVYVSCYNNTLHVRDCAPGYYKKADGTRFISKMMYDPDLQRCERTTSYCPRPLDAQVDF